MALPLQPTLSFPYIFPPFPPAPRTYFSSPCSSMPCPIRKMNGMVDIAPFVAKTYQIVCDPSTNHLITWGRANNSFIVVDPIAFSSIVLPSHFKHANFSSFVRQLNTHGFKKVDPDRWEFANEWFLRGQLHLLNNIGRRKQQLHRPCRPLQLDGSHSEKSSSSSSEMLPLLMEIQRLREDQNAMDMELRGMAKRVESTERRPQQMAAFLHTVAEDPEVLHLIMRQKQRARRQKQPRQVAETAEASCSSSGDVGSSNYVGVAWSPGAELERHGFAQSPSVPVDGVWSFSSGLLLHTSAEMEAAPMAVLPSTSTGLNLSSSFGDLEFYYST
ncbi:hypothetical protein Dimus_026486 [Dionaea muscipula]